MTIYTKIENMRTKKIIILENIEDNLDCILEQLDCENIVNEIEEEKNDL